MQESGRIATKIFVRLLERAKQKGVCGVLFVRPFLRPSLPSRLSANQILTAGHWRTLTKFFRQFVLPAMFVSSRTRLLLGDNKLHFFI